MSCGLPRPRPGSCSTMPIAQIPPYTQSHLSRVGLSPPPLPRTRSFGTWGVHRRWGKSHTPQCRSCRCRSRLYIGVVDLLHFAVLALVRTLKRSIRWSRLCVPAKSRQSALRKNSPHIKPTHPQTVNGGTGNAGGGGGDVGGMGNARRPGPSPSTTRCDATTRVLSTSIGCLSETARSVSPPHCAHRCLLHLPM